MGPPATLTVHMPRSPCNPRPSDLRVLPPTAHTQSSLKGRPPPESQRVFPLDLARCISDQKGAIRRVPEFLVHLLPVGTPRIGAPSQRPGPPHGPIPQAYLEMSPQYHSASCSEGGLPPLARLAGAGLALGGLGGSAGGQDKKGTLSTH